MRQPPPEVLASWPKPNYIDPETRGPALMIVELIALPLALLCLALRLFVRIKILRKTGWDDWLMVGAAVFGAGVTVCVVLAFARYGWDKHLWDLKLPVLMTGRQVSFAAQVLFIFATMLAKISILTSYLRLAPLDTWFRRFTYMAIWFIGVSNVAYFILLFVQCHPVSSYWNLLRTQQDCNSEAVLLLSQGIVTILSDFIVWVLPLPALYRAKLPLKQRIGLIVLFSFGMVVVLAACMRTYYIHIVVQESYDVTWEGFHLWLWTAVEVQLGIICGCVPWLKSLAKFWQPNRVATGKTTGASSSSGAASRAQSAGQRTVVRDGGAVYRMDNLGKYAKGPREMYIDLESCHESTRSRASSPAPILGRPGSVRST